MKRTYKTAQGQLIDLDALRLANEDAIAVGNMRVNARGDELGPGGDVAKGRNQVMNEYYQIQADPIETMMQQQNQGVNTQEEPMAPPVHTAAAPSEEKRTTRGRKAAAKKEIIETVSTGDTVVDAVVDTVANLDNETVTETATVEETAAKTLRGNLADSVAKEAQVNQTLLKPLNKRDGIQRI